MSEKTTRSLRTGLILVIVVLAFVASYQLATAADRGTAGGTTGGAGSSVSLAGTSADDGSLPCACCGGATASEPIEGAAVSDGTVQRITIDTSKGYYDPNIITLAAGIPAEITFVESSGCLGQVQSADLGFFEDLTGGDVTITLDAATLTPGTYEFSCGMQMVFGTIIVE